MRGPHPHVDGGTIAASVDAAVRALDLPVWPVTPAMVSVAVHEDAEHRPRVLFVINPTTASEEATIDLHRRATLTDLLDDSRHECREDGTVIFVPARSVRMLRIDLT
jgi:beta-galactosidase